MSDKVALTIDVTPEERQHIETMAHQHGFETPGAYLLALVKAADIDDDEETKEQVLEEFRQGWQAAKEGKTIPASELWDVLNSDD